ncbi:MAG: cupredoxin domain-containing protein [Chloroflexota bacterium]
MKFTALVTAAAATVLTLACGSTAPAASTPTAAATSAATAAATAAAKTTATAAATSAPAAAAAVSVTAVEITDAKYEYNPSTLAFKTGDTQVKFENKAGNQRPHTFTIKNAAGTEVFRSDRIQPGTSADLKISLAEAGTYKFLCVVQGHEDKGQTGTLTVTKS